MNALMEHIQLTLIGVSSARRDAKLAHHMMNALHVSLVRSSVTVFAHQRYVQKLINTWIKSQETVLNVAFYVKLAKGLHLIALVATSAGPLFRLPAILQELVYWPHCAKKGNFTTLTYNNVLTVL
jgi:hypothetical protein